MLYRGFTLLIFLAIAPACAPASEEKVEQLPLSPLVLLTDEATWTAVELQHYRDSLELEHYRVLVSGYADETPAELMARLPWLLQPGVSLFIYDVALAGPAASDSLRNALRRLGHDTPVKVLER